MSEIKRFAIELKNFNKIVPSFFIKENELIITISYIEQTPKETDTFITQEQFMDIISTPVIKDIDSSKYKNITYDNILLKYKNFPGYGLDFFSIIDAHIRLKKKFTSSVIANSNIRNQITYMGFANLKEDLIVNSEKPKPRINDVNYNLSWVMPIVFKFDNEQSNFLNSDFVFFHSRPGYYCNLPVQHITFDEFYNNNYYGISVDDESKFLFEQLKNS